MSSLHAHNPRSHGRSKSPGGHMPERSRSRDTRAPPPAPETTKKATSRHYDSDSEEERYRAPPRGKDSYYAPDSDDKGRKHPPPTGRALPTRSRYRSESEEDDEEDEDEEEDEYHRSSQRRPSPSPPLSGNDTDGFSRSRHRPSALSRDLDSATRSRDPDRKSSVKFHTDAHGSAFSPPNSQAPSASASAVSSRFGGDSDHEHPGSHPSYAKPERFNYAQPADFAYPPSGSPGWPGPVNGGTAPPVSDRAAPPVPGAFPHPASIPPDADSVSASRSMAPQPYAKVPPWQYAQPDPNITYTSKSNQPPDPHWTMPTTPYTASAEPQFPDQLTRSVRPTDSVPRYTQSSAPQFPHPPARDTKREAAGLRIETREPQSVQSPSKGSEPHYIEIAPGAERDGPSSSPPGASHRRPVSSANLGVGGGWSSGGRPPPSPLLEPYQGTYQTISPMPSPLAGPVARLDDDLSDLELDIRSGPDRRPRTLALTASADDRIRREDRSRRRDQDRDRDRDREGRWREDDDDAERGHRPAEILTIAPTPSSAKRVSFYDATADAMALKGALSHARVDPKPLRTILPYLTSHEILALRAEYKNHAKVHGKGINIAKHLKLKLGNTSWGKVCYATALGRWESEAYWANSYYQAGTSRRELLIETLIGRSNSEIREIKECFRDTRYSDSLEKCMKSELKADKFRTAILLALEERRQSEHEPRDVRLIQRDVQELRRALVSREGGETAMIQIILVRSDNHLREVLRTYEGIHRQNFAKAMISKSRNLVGETLAHILNGVINRPMRDALLLHQAICESRPGKERAELLISRLVRLHWEPRHLEAVKQEYRKRYGERVEEAIAQEVIATSSASEWGEFCIELARSSAYHSGGR
ncbi:hypothetical protein Egran_01452 [Elaphomyces granulatus]|uniref:Annexin n=1 Tax=Elaphomyces granulatus TaxID=519963 RepID=A0A232M3W3_9EURO|nr:hypothetical protein Egran_01452 [Elaphomyces granulatus]